MDPATPLGTASKEWRIWRSLTQRFLNTAGLTKVKLAVPNAVTSVTYTFPYADSDAEYGVVATPTWSTTVRVSARSTTALTLTFGTASGATDTVDIITFRS